MFAFADRVNGPIDTELSIKKIAFKRTLPAMGNDPLGDAVIAINNGNIIGQFGKLQ